MPDIILGAFPALFYLLITTLLRKYYDSHFTDEENSNSEEQETCPRSPQPVLLPLKNSFSPSAWSTVHTLGNASLILPGCPYTQLAILK